MFNSKMPSLTVAASVVFLIMLLISWESPYSLVSRCKMRQAYRSLCSVRTSELAAARDLFQIHYQVEMSNKSASRRKCSWYNSNGTKTARIFPSTVLIVALVLLGFRFDSSSSIMGSMFSRYHAVPQAIIIISLQASFLSLYAMKKLGRRPVLLTTILITLLARLVMIIWKLTYPLVSFLAFVQSIFWQAALFTLAVESYPYGCRSESSLHPAS